MDLHTFLVAGLIVLALAVVTLGYWCVAQQGHIAAIRGELRTLNYRWVVAWKVANRRLLTDAELTEAGQMEAEAREMRMSDMI